MTTSPKSHGISNNSLRLGDEVLLGGTVLRVVRLAPYRQAGRPACSYCVLNEAPPSGCCVVREDEPGYSAMAVVPVDDIPVLTLKGLLA